MCGMSHWVCLISFALFNHGSLVNDENVLLTRSGNVLLRSAPPFQIWPEDWHKECKTGRTISDHISSVLEHKAFILLQVNTILLVVQDFK